MNDPEHGRHPSKTPPPEHVRLSEARRHDLSAEDQRCIRADPSRAVRRALAGRYEPNPDADIFPFERDILPLADDVLAALAEDPDLYVRRLVATRRKLPAAVLETLSKDSDEEVRESMAKREDLESEAAERLAWSGDACARRVARHPGLSTKVLDHLAETAGQNVLVALASRSDLSMAALASLCRRGEGDVMDNLLLIEALPPAEVQEMAASRHWERRWAAAGRGELEDRFLEPLSKDPEAKVRMALAARAALPQEIVHRLSTDAESLVVEFLVLREEVPFSVLIRAASRRRTDDAAGLALGRIQSLSAMERLEGLQSIPKSERALRKTAKRILEELARA